jgi:hypothetical protein
MSAAIDHGLEPTAPVQAKPPLFLNNGNPAAVLHEAKKVALKADWSLARWEEFSKTARACFQPDCLPEEFEAFMRVVRERFEVKPGPRFDPDPRTWAPHDD